LVVRCEARSDEFGVGFWWTVRVVSDISRFVGQGGSRWLRIEQHGRGGGPDPWSDIAWPLMAACTAVMGLHWGRGDLESVITF
jgi:hypothetical protein